MSFVIVTLAVSHYGDVIMGTMASQITSLTIVYSTAYSGADQRKHQSSATLAFVREIHRGPVNSPHKWPVTRNMFPFDDVIMKWAQPIRFAFCWNWYRYRECCATPCITTSREYLFWWCSFRLDIPLYLSIFEVHYSRVSTHWSENVVLSWVQDRSSVLQLPELWSGTQQFSCWMKLRQLWTMDQKPSFKQLLKMCVNCIEKLQNINVLWYHYYWFPIDKTLKKFNIKGVTCHLLQLL